MAAKSNKHFLCDDGHKDPKRSNDALLEGSSSTGYEIFDSFDRPSTKAFMYVCSLHHAFDGADATVLHSIDS